MGLKESVEFISYIIRAFCIISVVLLIIVSYIPPLSNQLLNYGRLRPIGLKFSAPKSYFRIYYAFLVVFNTLLIILINTNHELITSKIVDNFKLAQYSEDARYLPYLLQLQGLRRLYETFYVHKFSRHSNINILLIFLGVIYYFLLSLLFNWNAILSISLGNENITAMNRGILFYVSILLFLYSSYQQYYCHLYLAQLRLENNSNGYYLPQGYGFKSCTNPHYYYEFLIYLSFMLVDRFNSIELVLISALVFTNLAISGYSNHKWYLENMPQHKEILEKRHPLFPFLAKS